MILTLVCCLLALTSSARKYKESYPEIQPKVDLRPDKTILLYPKGQNAKSFVKEGGKAITCPPREDNGLRGEEKCNAAGNRSNVGDDARMDFYLPKNGNGQMVVIFPGGGYHFLSTFNEGVYIAKFLLERGIAACVVKYRMPNLHQTVTLDDALNAMRYCRWYGNQLGIKQIGVMGGSAGGHVSTLISVHYTDSITRPDFAVLLYPRITLRRGERCGCTDYLIGTDDMWTDKLAEQQKALTLYSPDNFVNDQTPPTFMVLSADDKTVLATNMLPYYTKLIENKVPTELHVFPTGGHGWGFSKAEYKGPKGEDKFAHYRAEFEQSLTRWLEDQRQTYTK